MAISTTGLFASMGKSSGSTSNAAASDNRTSIRFSLRTLLLLSTAIALTATAPAVYCSYLPAQQARNVGWLWAGVFGGGLISAVLVAGERYWMERRAGRRLYALTSTAAWLPKLQSALWLPSQLFVLAVAIAQIAVWTWLIGRIPGGSEYRIVGVAGVAMAAALVFWLFIALWGRQVLLCERGVLYLGRTFAWKRFTKYRWHRRHPEVLILTGRPRRFAMFVPADQRDKIIALLTEKLNAEQARSAAVAPPAAAVISRGKVQPMAAENQE
jgi:hypothetical protein